MDNNPRWDAESDTNAPSTVEIGYIKMPTNVPDIEVLKPINV